MRVQLGGRNERGAVAVMSAALFIVFAVLAGFTVDFGMAYAKRQQLQVATDAGSLAAAQVFKGRTEACATLKDDPGLTYAALRSQAQTAADSWAAKNFPSLTGKPITIECNGDALSVTFQANGESSTTFGGLAGVNGPIPLGRSSVATIGNAPYVVGNMRPWGICSKVVLTPGNNGTVVFVPMEDGATATLTAASVCGPDSPPGGWWVAKCKGQGNGTGDTEYAVEIGCATSVTYQAVTPQQASWTPEQLYNALTAKCPSKTESETCLLSDNGNNFHLTSPKWQPLVGQTFSMPVFCTRPTCKEMALAGSGSNASYAIYRFATVELCGFRMHASAPSTGWPTTGPCATANPNNYKSSDIVSGSGFFLVVKALTGGPAGSDYTMREYRAARISK